MSSTQPKTYDTVPSTHVAFIGLGVMGYPMAGHLALAGHAVTVYNRNATKAQAWCKEYAATAGPRSAATPRGAAQSWQMDNRGKTMVADKFDFGFAVDWMRKDLGLVLDEAKRNGARLPVTALVDQFYADVQHMGGGRWDTSSLIKRLG